MVSVRFVINIGNFGNTCVPKYLQSFLKVFAQQMSRMLIPPSFRGFFLLLTHKLNISVSLDRSSLTGPFEVFTQLSTITYPILILSVTQITTIDYHLVCYFSTLFSLICCKLHKIRNIVCLFLWQTPKHTWQVFHKYLLNY